MIRLKSNVACVIFSKSADAESEVRQEAINVRVGYKTDEMETWYEIQDHLFCR